MRNYIHDDTLLLILNAIEDHLGYTISAETLPESMWSTHGGAMGLHEGKWQFWHNPNDPPTQLTLLHELLHIVLFIEGWPAWQIRPFTIKDHIDNILYDFVANFTQHIRISQMVEDLGYSEREQVAQGMDKRVRACQQKQLVPPHHQRAWMQVELFHAAEMLLSQSDPHRKEQFRNSLQQFRPKFFSIVDTMCSTAAKHQPLDSQSSEYLLYEILEILEMQKENLRPSRSDNACPDFFSRICAQVGRGYS